MRFSRDRAWPAGCNSWQSKVRVYAVLTVFHGRDHTCEGNFLLLSFFALKRRRDVEGADSTERHFALQECSVKLSRALLYLHRRNPKFP